MESNGLWEEDHRRVKRLGRREDTCCRHFMLEEVDPSSGKTYLQLIQEKLVELQQMQTICEKSYLRTHYVNAYSNMTKSNVRSVILKYKACYIRNKWAINYIHSFIHRKYHYQI
jgi:hypothetical protein